MLDQRCQVITIWTVNKLQREVKTCYALMCAPKQISKLRALLSAYNFHLTHNLTWDWWYNSNGSTCMQSHRLQFGPAHLKIRAPYYNRKGLGYTLSLIRFTAERVSPLWLGFYHALCYNLGIPTLPLVEFLLLILSLLWWSSMVTSRLHPIPFPSSTWYFQCCSLCWSFSLGLNLPPKS